MTTLHLDIGCGDLPRNPYGMDLLYGVDFGSVDPKRCDRFFSVNLGYEPLPFAESTFDSVSAYDLLEHIPRTGIKDGKPHLPFVYLMNEIYRVLKPNGIFIAIFPYYPKLEAFSDPTHVNYITKFTHIYFTAPTNWASIYGFRGSFKILTVKSMSSHAYTRGDDRSLRSFLSLILHYIKHGRTHLFWEFCK